MHCEWGSFLDRDDLFVGKMLFKAEILLEFLKKKQVVRCFFSLYR